MKNYIIEVCHVFSQKHPKRFKWLSRRLESIIEVGVTDQMLLWRYEHTITLLNRSIKLYQEGHSDSVALMARLEKEKGRTSYVIKNSVEKLGRDIDFMVSLRNVLENEKVKKQYKNFSSDLGPEKLTPIMKKVKSQVHNGLQA